MSIFCLGCREEVSNRASDHRNLSSEPSRQVLRIWESFIARKLEKEAKEAEQFIQSMIDNHCMCRKCFSAYDRLNKLQKGIKDNLDEALDVLLSTPRRKRQNSPYSVYTEVPKSKCLPQPPLAAANSASGKSPIISVSAVKLSYHTIKSIR